MVVDVFESEKIYFFDFFLPIFRYFFKIKASNEKTWKFFAILIYLSLKGIALAFLAKIKSLS